MSEATRNTVETFSSIESKFFSQEEEKINCPAFHKSSSLDHHRECQKIDIISSVESSIDRTAEDDLSRLHSYIHQSTGVCEISQKVLSYAFFSSIWIH